MRCECGEEGGRWSGPRASLAWYTPGLGSWRLFILDANGHTWRSAPVLGAREPSISNVYSLSQLSALLGSADPGSAVLHPFGREEGAAGSKGNIQMFSFRFLAFARPLYFLCLLPSLPHSCLVWRTGVGKLCPGKGQILNISGKSSTLPLEHKGSHRQFSNQWAWLRPNKILFTKKNDSTLSLAFG